MTNPQIALAVFAVLSLGASALYMLAFGWPADEKLRPEDFASEADYAAEIERRTKGPDNRPMTEAELTATAEAKDTMSFKLEIDTSQLDRVFVGEAQSMSLDHEKLFVNLMIDDSAKAYTLRKLADQLDKA